jgi:hypothetical protein
VLPDLFSGIHQPIAALEQESVMNHLRNLGPFIRQLNRTPMKEPLLFSAGLAAAAGLMTMFVSTGGTDKELRWDLLAAAAALTFLVTLVLTVLLISLAAPEKAPEKPHRPRPADQRSWTGGADDRRQAALSRTVTGRKPRP